MMRTQFSRLVAWIVWGAMLFVVPTATAATGGAFCRPPRIISRLPKGAVLDSAWQNVRPPVQLCRVLNHKRMWAASYAWFQLDARPGLTLSYEQLDSLYATGSIADTTMVASVRLEYPIRAASMAEARQVALRRLPTIDSRRLAGEFQEFWRTSGH